MDSFLRKKIEVYSLFFSICVVFFHVCPTPEEYLWCHNDIIYWICTRINHYLSNLGTYANLYFVFISALLMYYNITKENYKSKLHRRVFSLVIPLILWNIIYALPFVIIRGEEFVVLDVIFSRYCVPMWFITALVLYTIIMPVVDLVTRNKYVGVFFSFTMLVSANGINESLLAGISEFRYYQELTRFVTFLGIYLLGAVVGRHYYGILFEENYRKNVLFRILTVVGILLPFCGDLLSINSQLLSLAHVISIWGLIGKHRFTKELPKFVGDSFGIYAIHTGLLVILVTIFVKNGIFLEQTSMNFVVYLLGRTIVVFVFVVLSLLFTEVLRGCFSGLYRVLYGSRNI